MLGWLQTLNITAERCRNTKEVQGMLQLCGNAKNAEMLKMLGILQMLEMRNIVEMLEMLKYLNRGARKPL